MPRYHFHVSGSLTVNDLSGRNVSSAIDLRRVALLEAAMAANANASGGKEACIVVTVTDLTGAVHLKVHLVSQVETS